MKPRFWTLEKITLVAQYILRLLVPAMKKLNMQEYNAMPSNRRRVIGSSAPSGLEPLSDAEYKKLYKSPLQVAREHCVESEQTDFTQVDSLLFMNEFNHIKKGEEPTFTVTSTPIRAGSTGANMVPLETDLCLKLMHIPMSEFDFGDLPSRQRFKHGAQCTPVSFAGCMLRGVLNKMGPPEDWSIFFEKGGPPGVHNCGVHNRLVADAAMVHFQGIWRPGRIAEQDEGGALLCMAHDMSVYRFNSTDVVSIDRRVGTSYGTLGLLEAASAAFAQAQCLLNKEPGVVRLQVAAMHPEWVKENLKHCPWTRAFVYTEPGTEPGRRALDNVGEPCEVIEIVHDRGDLTRLYRVHYPRSRLGAAYLVVLKQLSY